MKYDHNAVEQKWQEYWAKNGTFEAENPSDFSSLEEQKEPYYVLDMFPYPSGAGLHVGHPLGYIASDIYARYKRHKGFNVLHPQGYDSFGLPAEQYAIQTGQHPANTTEINIEGCLDEDGNILSKYVDKDGNIKEAALIDKQLKTNNDDENHQQNVIKGYRRQLDKIGFSFDWSREVRTSDPEYYKWTQWIFIQLFESWYNKETDKAEAIDTLTAKFASEGNATVNAACDEDIEPFSAEAWNGFSTKKKQEILLKYRLTYLAETEVNWCAALGTVLANDEIINGVSERGGHPVVRKKMTQWSMRISAYAQRLLDGLQEIDWPQPLKDSQTNWIGRSQGAMVNFPLEIPPTPKGGATQPGYMTGGNNSHLLISRAKEMRDNPTHAESVLWEHLVSKKLGYKFRRQHLIDDFIADFVCLSKKLIVEVDGDIHDAQVEKDEARTVILEDLGFKVIRFKNDEVTDNLEGVLAEIKSQLETRTVPPSGLPTDKVGVRGISVFTTRPDTIFGVTFMTLAPEHELVEEITTPAQKKAVASYISETAKRSERERMADVKNITGVFTGAFAEHPFTKEPVPIWIGDYVLAGYGTGAVMAVPCGDQRDHDFAKHFAGAEGMPPIKNIFKDVDVTEAAHAGKDGTVITNSDFLNDLPYKKALKSAIYELENLDQGSGKINYRLRDAVFSRQRYWGEPFPVYYVDGMPQMIDEKYLPLRLPEVEKYLPTEEGEPPLGRAEKWHWDTNNNEVVSVEDGVKPPSGVWGIELNTMPGWAGSSWYFFRYMDAHNEREFASAEAMNYWKNVDLYIGGSEHATGHLLYSRFWVKFLHDRGFVPVEEPFKKLINQGMILGEGAFLYFIEPTIMYQNEEMIMPQDCPLFLDRKFLISYSKLQDEDTWVLDGELAFHNKKLQSYFYEKLLEKYQNFESEDKEILEYVNNIDKVKVASIFAYARRVNIDLLKGTSDSLNIEKLKPELHKNNLNDIEFFLDNGELTVSREIEKMSKSKYNVVNPDDICEDYGADTLRMYEMFLGPLEQAKPWNTAGISGVYNFLKKFWKLFHEVDKEGNIGTFRLTDTPLLGLPAGEAGAGRKGLKILHKTIKKVEEDIENFSFNTSVSTFMIAVNELTAINCNAREVLEPLTVLLSPYAPHIAEELWQKLGHSGSISAVSFPVYEEKYTKETSKDYPISFNGKMRFTMNLPLDLSKEEIEKAVMENEKTQEYLAGRTPKKVIVVPGKIVNLVG